MNTEIQKISLDCIDDPYIAMRTELSGKEMDELMASMKTYGLIEPVVLRKLGDRYEVIAGHRRTYAARRLSWLVIDAKVVTADDELALGLRLAENSDRADVNPVDEACFIGEIMLKYKYTPQMISEKMGRSMSWVQTRLDIFEMPDYMKEHLRTGRYSVGAAQWIAKIPNDETRKYYAFYAAQFGVSIAGAEAWFRNLEADNFVPPMTTEQIPDGNVAAPKYVSYTACARCGGREDIMKLRNVFIHENGQCQDEGAGAERPASLQPGQATG